MKKNSGLKILIISTVLVGIVILLVGIVLSFINSVSSETSLFVIVIGVGLMVFSPLSYLLIKTFHGHLIDPDYYRYEDKKEKPKEKETDVVNSYDIVFPFFGIKDDNCYDGKETYEWLTEENKNYILSSWNDMDMKSYISNEELKNKISNMVLSITSDGLCNIKINASSELNKNELDEVLKFVKGQCSDGWGEDNFDFDNYSISFWRNDNNWYIKYKG